jgi:uncharacterized linocin/CFP29 family protein
MKMNQDVIISTPNGVQLSGDVARRLLETGFDPKGLRPYIGNDGRSYITQNAGGELKAVPIRNAQATLRKDEWKHYDTAVIDAATKRLKAVNFFNARGMSYNIPNGLGSTVLEYEDMSDMADAQLNMDGITRGDDDRVEFNINYLPLPIIHKDFTINARMLAASRTTGRPLDTTQAEVAGRKVAEMVETITLVGASAYAYGGGTLRGILDFPNVNSYTLAAHWDDSAATGETILADVLGMKQASIGARHYGPWVLLIPTGFETSLDEDFKAGSDKSTRQRLMEVEGIADIIVCDYLTADYVALVQLDSSTFRMVNGMGITVVEWKTEGGLKMHYKVMAIMVPQPRSDQNSRCGIVVGTK